MPGTGAAAAADLLGKIRTLARTFPVLVLPYGDPDINALARADMQDTIATTVARGRLIASTVLQNTAVAGPVDNVTDGAVHLLTTIADPPGGALTDEAWASLKSLGYTSAILDRSGITASKAAKGSGLVTVKASGDADAHTIVVPGASYAPQLGPLLTKGVPSDWVPQLNLLAAVAVTNRAVPTPMVLSPARDWSADPRGTAVLTSTLNSFSEIGLMSGTPLADLTGTATATATGNATGTTTEGAAAPFAAPAASLTYPKAARAQELSTDYLRQLTLLDRDIGRLGDALSAAKEPDSPSPTDVLQPLADALLDGTSAAWRGTEKPDRLALHTVSETIDSLYDGVRVRRSTSSYTLASSSAPLLLNVQNTLPYQVKVRIEVLGGARVGLRVKESGIVTLPKGPRTVPIKLPASVSGSGTFTVLAQLDGPDGSPWGSQVPLTVTSRAYGALTLVLMLVAGGLLLIMVVLRIRQRWRNHQRARKAAA